MGVIQEFFNNREIAIGIWVIIGLAVILPTKPARQFIKTAIPILFCKKFVIFYIVFLSFLGLVLFALNWAGLWDLTLLKATVFWVLFVELPLFAKAIEKADGGRFFSKLIRENVAIVVAIEFFVGFWTFSLITEIILIPLTVLISKVSAIRKSLPNTIVCCRTSNDLQINLKKLARRLDLQIGENYMKRSR